MPLMSQSPRSRRCELLTYPCFEAERGRMRGVLALAIGLAAIHSWALASRVVHRTSARHRSRDPGCLDDRAQEWCLSFPFQSVRGGGFYSSALRFSYQSPTPVCRTTPFCGRPRSLIWADRSTAVSVADYSVLAYSLGSSGRRNSTVLRGFRTPPVSLDTRLARATESGTREVGSLWSPSRRESEATDGR